MADYDDFLDAPDGVIVGLHAPNNGRRCSMHDRCGYEVEVNSLIRFKYCRVKINGFYEDAIKAVLICFGEERCTVGFLPRTVSHQAGAREKYHDEFAVVTFLHSQSDDAALKAESAEVRGKGLFRLLKNIQSLE